MNQQYVKTLTKAYGLIIWLTYIEQ